MNWTGGYITDVSYPAFFYREMQPLWLSTVAGFSGFSAPNADAPFTLCELGCGVGINLLVAAVCHPDAHFVGVDFNEEHLHIAQAAARASGIANLEFIHSDFQAFARNSDRQFDFITSHGVWSWIAPIHRSALLSCVERSLKSNGLFYLHYMCHPGSTDLLPLQHVLNLCAHHMPGASPRKAQIGLQLLQQLADGGLFADKPEMLRHLANMARRESPDLAHEFLTDHWQPQHCVDIHQQGARSGLSYLASADVFNNLDPSLSIPGKLQALIRQTRVPAIAETLKDLARNAHQRMDLFQKAPAGLNDDTFLAWFGATRFRLLPQAKVEFPLSFSTPIGPIMGPEPTFSPLLGKLAAESATGAELLQLPAFAGNPGGLLQSLQLLMMQVMAHPELVPIRADHDQVEHLSKWFERNNIILTVIAECGTALGTSKSG